jgi:transposase-like protein
MLKIVNDPAVDVSAAVEAGVDLDELCRLAAQQMLALAVETERRSYLEAYAEVVDEAGRRVVVGNGHLPSRTVTTGAGVVEVTVPRVHDPRPGQGFSSVILPPYMRRSPKVTEVLPVLYLRGLSTGDFAPALEGFFGSDAGLSPLDDPKVDRGVADRTWALDPT